MINAQKLAGGSAPVYLLHGAETFLTRQAVEWLREHVLAGAIEDFNCDRFDARERPDPERITQAARTLPMMAPRRLVLVRNAEALFDLAKGTVKPLIEYLSDPDPMCCLVFHAMKRVKKTGTLYKRTAKVACVYEAQPLRERALASWVEERARARKRRIHADAAALLVEAIGRDLAGLDAAIERLTLFVADGAPIERAHVEQTVSHTRTRTVWELVDALAERHTGKALQRAHLLLGQGEVPLRLIGLVIRQYRQLLIGRSARARGASPEQAASLAGVPPFRARRFNAQLNNYQGAELMSALERLAKADRALKGSKLPAELIFEGLLLDLCAPAPRG